MPGLVKFQNEKPEVPLFLLNVVDGTKETMTSGVKFLTDNHFDLPNYRVSDTDAYQKYGLRKFSLLLAYDKDGRLVRSLTSFGEEDVTALAKELGY